MLCMSKQFWKKIEECFDFFVVKCYTFHIWLHLEFVIFDIFCFAFCRLFRCILFESKFWNFVFNYFLKFSLLFQLFSWIQALILTWSHFLPYSSQFLPCLLQLSTPSHILAVVSLVHCKLCESIRFLRHLGYHVGKWAFSLCTCSLLLGWCVMSLFLYPG